MKLIIFMITLVSSLSAFADAPASCSQLAQSKYSINHTGQSFVAKLYNYSLNIDFSKLPDSVSYYSNYGQNRDITVDLIAPGWTGSYNDLHLRSVGRADCRISPELCVDAAGVLVSTFYIIKNNIKDSTADKRLAVQCLMDIWEEIGIRSHKMTRTRINN